MTDFSRHFVALRAGLQRQHALIFPTVFITQSADRALGPNHYAGNTNQPRKITNKQLKSMKHFILNLQRYFTAERLLNIHVLYFTVFMVIY